MAKKNNGGIWLKTFVGLVITLLIGSFLYADTKLSKEVYVEHKTAQDRAFEKIEKGFESTNEKLDAIILREIDALKKVAAKK